LTHVVARQHELRLAPGTIRTSLVAEHDELDAVKIRHLTDA
jgi:hypothetical protein